jgi:hypothetical protein
MSDQNKSDKYWEMKYYKYKTKYLKKLKDIEGLYVTHQRDIRKIIDGSMNTEKLILTQASTPINSFSGDEIIGNISENTNNSIFSGGALEMDKEIIKIVPEASKEFINLYFAVKMGLHFYHEMNNLKQLSSKDVAKAIIKLAKMKVTNKLNKNDTLITNIVKGINHAKKSGKDETNKNVYGYTNAFNKMYNNKKIKTIGGQKEFKINILKLLSKLFDAEHKIVNNMQSQTQSSNQSSQSNDFDFM